MIKIKAAIKKFLNSRGYDIVRFATDFGRDEMSMAKRVRGFTGITIGGLAGLMDAVKYVSQNRIPGAIVECGVWRGGSVMAALYTLLQLEERDREIYLFDTFEGMSSPTAKDVRFDGTRAEDVLREEERREELANYWCYASLQTVKRSVLSTGYPEDKIHFIKGKVEETLPGAAPEEIALLRLDTDWYESTQHELVHLYPRLVAGGVLIIDDYGHWKGARQAADEFFDALPFRPLLSRLDYTARLAVKPANN